MALKVDPDTILKYAPLIIIIRDPGNMWKISDISRESGDYYDLISHLQHNGDLFNSIYIQDQAIVSRKLGSAILAHKSSVDLRYRLFDGKKYRWIEDHCKLYYNEVGDVINAVSSLWISNLPLEWSLLLNGSDIWNTLNAKVRHDILNQLTAVLGYLELSSDIITDPMLKDFSQKEQNAAEKIRERMIFTREYQKIGLMEFCWYSLEDIIKESLNQIILNGISLDIDVGRTKIYTDKNFRLALEKILENIPMHAIGVTNIRIYALSEDQFRVLIIEDNGCGIRDQDKLRLFELGFGNGGGYGLFIAEKILSVFGIRIEESGIAGKNAIFKLYIPSWIIDDNI